MEFFSCERGIGKLVCVSPGIITLLAFCSDLVDNQKWVSNIEIHISGLVNDLHVSIDDETGPKNDALN